MADTHSLSMIVPVADASAADAYFAAIGWGGPVFVVDISEDGALPVTYKGCHTYVSAEYVATLQAAQASGDPELAGLVPVYIYAEEASEPKFDQALAAHTPPLQRYFAPPNWD